MESALSSARARTNVILAGKCDTNSSNNNFYLNTVKSKASTAYLAYGAVYTSAFQNPSPSKEAKYTTCPMKMSFICLRMKNHFHVKGWALTLVLIQRPGGNGSLSRLSWLLVPWGISRERRLRRNVPCWPLTVADALLLCKNNQFVIYLSRSFLKIHIMLI